MNKDNSDLSFKINFAPQQILANFENELKKNFENKIRGEIQDFCGSQSYWNGNKLVQVPGAGLLLIREFLEKKFDDPETIKWMENYYKNNFERIMGEAMAKALQHKANAFAFHMAKDAVIETKK